jgi:hypothetical protein
MQKILEWIEKNHEELSLIANFNQIKKDAVIEKLLDLGLEAALEEVAYAHANIDY